MSQEEKAQAIEVDGTVEGSATATETKEKEGLLKRLWNKPIVRKITKGIAAGAACVASGLVGYKIGAAHIKWEPLPESEENEDETEEEDDAE